MTEDEIKALEGAVVSLGEVVTSADFIDHWTRSKAKALARMVNAVPGLLADLRSVQEENARLAKALEPFAARADLWDDEDGNELGPEGIVVAVRMGVRFFRSARAALNQDKPL